MRNQHPMNIMLDNDKPLKYFRIYICGMVFATINSSSKQEAKEFFARNNPDVKRSEISVEEQMCS